VAAARGRRATSPDPPPPASPEATGSGASGDEEYTAVLRDLVGPHDLEGDPRPAFADDTDLDSDWLPSDSESESDSA